MRAGCLAGLCACLGPGVTAGAAAAEIGAQPAEPKPASLSQKWIAALLPQLAGGDREYAQRVLKSCAQSHYDDLGMQAVVDRFRGRMDEFLDFPRKEWGWIIDYDRGRGVVEVDENKSACVCPLVPKDHGAGLGMLCYCSEGFAERLFSAVSGSPVRAEVVASILRGQKSCRYRIDLKPSGA
ncbi:MAG: hypothetical protein ABFD52_12665 [Acidobacteriota bacterium]